MKTVITIALLIISIGFSYAQNVGFGTTTPAYPLTVIGNASTGKGIVQKAGDVEVGFSTSNLGGYLQTWSNHPLLFATNNGNAAMALTTNGNFGIGVMQPTNKLHIIGSAATSNNATIYSTNTGATGNGIIGLSNAPNTNGVQGFSIDGTGIYGYSNDFRGVAGSTISGTALYGNSIAGYGLEISGKVKIAGGNTNPTNGATLTSDALGNAVWKPRRVAFKVSGVSSSYNVIPTGSSRRVQFDKELFDLGNNYALLDENTPATSNSSVFTAPVSGVYHFSVAASIDPDGSFQDIESASLVLNRSRNGIETQLTYSVANRQFRMVGAGEVTDRAGFYISITESLLAGDRIYVVIFQNSGTDGIMSSHIYNYFSGHLVFAD